MKKLLFFTTLLFTFCFKAQEKFETYNIDYWSDKKTYNIEVSDKSGELEKIWIEVHSLDRLNNEGYFIVELKKMNDFISFLNETKLKYEEWEKIAKENKVEELNKEIETKTKSTVNAAFKYGKWQFDYGNKLKAKFLLNKDGAKLIITTGNLQATSNQFIKNDGLALVFSDLDEINDFIQKLDISKMEEVMKNKTAKGDLFK